MRIPLGLRSDRRCLGESRPSAVRSDGGQHSSSQWPFSCSEAQTNRFLERLYPLTPGRFGRDGLLHGGSPDAQGAADLLCPVLHPLGDSPGEPGRIHLLSQYLPECFNLRVSADKIIRLGGEIRLWYHGGRSISADWDRSDKQDSHLSLLSLWSQEVQIHPWSDLCGWAAR